MDGFQVMFKNSDVSIDENVIFLSSDSPLQI